MDGVAGLIFGLRIRFCHFVFFGWDGVEGAGIRFLGVEIGAELLGSEC